MTQDEQLAQDTINCTLNMAGYDIGVTNQFEKAHALMDMAQEYVANRESLAHYEYVFDHLLATLRNVRKIDIDNENDVSEALDMAQNFGRVRLSSRR